MGKIDEAIGGVGRDEVMQMLGAARYAEWLNNQTASHLMQFLMTVEKDKLYLMAGYKSFVEFLDGSGLKSKSTYYDHRKLLLAEGPEQYDLFEDLGIPVRVRSLLTTGDYTVDGNEIVIGGDQRYGFGEGKVIKTAFEQLIREKIAAEKQLGEATAKLDANAKKITRLELIETEYEELVDNLDHGTPYTQAYLLLMKAFVTFISEVKELGHEERSEREEPDMATFGEQFRQLGEAYAHGDRIYQADAASVED